jgi:hypothetical protein
VKPLLDYIRAATTSEQSARTALDRVPRYELDQAARGVGVQPMGLRKDQVVDRVMEALTR